MKPDFLNIAAAYLYRQIFHQIGLFKIPEFSQPFISWFLYSECTENYL